MAAAPFSSAWATYRCPSVLDPESVTNRAPGPGSGCHTIWNLFPYSGRRCPREGDAGEQIPQPWCHPSRVGFIFFKRCEIRKDRRKKIRSFSACVFLSVVEVSVLHLRCAERDVYDGADGRSLPPATLWP